MPHFHNLVSLIMAGCYLATLMLGVSIPARAAERDVDLELVLAVDSSDSVDNREFALQIIGLADAFRHPLVIKALGAGPHKAIVVSMVEWADRNQQIVLIPSTVLTGKATAYQLSDRIRSTPRTYERGVTSVSGIIDFAVSTFARNGLRGRRLVIDISSDGRQNDGRPVAEARGEALALGLTINALTINNEYGRLDEYYRKEVVGGPSAFVEVANDYAAYPEAILRKLIRELTNNPVSLAPRGPVAEPVRELEGLIGSSTPRSLG
jgi:hypothetical protein